MMAQLQLLLLIKKQVNISQQVLTYILLSCRHAWVSFSKELLPI